MRKKKIQFFCKNIAQNTQATSELRNEIFLKHLKDEKSIDNFKYIDRDTVNSCFLRMRTPTVPKFMYIRNTEQ